MDHWGDPWSDKADDTPATETKVTSPQLSAQPSAPALLDGLLDDAGWGYEDASFGDWAVAPENEVSGVAKAGTHTDEAERQRDCQTGLDRDTISSEGSSSTTTVQQEESVQEAGIDSLGQFPPDDGSSARPSISISDRSNDPPVESPRTSVDEERSGILSKTLEETPHDLHITVTGREDVKATFGGDHPGVEAINHTSNQDIVSDMLGEKRCSDSHSLKKSQKDASSVETTHPDGLVAITPSSREIAVSIDTGILDELFPPVQEVETLEEAPQDPIYSTTGRKAWYRLTRKQTMRESNSGNAGDNYIRVTWANSEIRKTVHTTIAKWARQDRLSGVGPGARASFYWDSVAPIDTTLLKSHLRRKTAISAPRTGVPARQSLPPPSGKTPLTFDWSSATVVNHWNLDDDTSRPISLPLAVGSSTTGTNKEQEVRPISMRIPLPTPGTPKEVTEPHSGTPEASNSIATPIIPSIPLFPDENAHNSTTNTNVSAINSTASGIFDDDDEWGEMVGSASPAPLDTNEPISQKSFPNTPPIGATGATQPVTPPRRSFSSQKHPNDAMNASHITRLQGTISPTSAFLGPRSFVPSGVEKGPIGPGLLRPTSRHALPKLQQQTPPPPPPLPTAVIVPKRYGKTVQQASNAREETSYQPQPIKPVSSPIQSEESITNMSGFPAAPPCLAQTSALALEPSLPDAWADADFAFLESAAPIHPAAAAAARPQPNMVSPLPLVHASSTAHKSLNAVPPLLPSASLSVPRSSPHSHLLPLSQPSVVSLAQGYGNHAGVSSTSTSTSSSSSSTTAVTGIQCIVDGLPDLRYMLL